MKNWIKYFLIIIGFLFVQGGTYVIDSQKNAVWHNEKGLYYFKDGFYYEAVYEFKLAIILSNNTAATASFYNNLGLVYEKAGRDDLSLQCYQKSIKMNPNFLAYYQNMIKIYKNRKMLPVVLSKYNKSAKKPNANPKTWLVLGLTYLEMDKYEEAIDCLNKYKKLEPYSVIADGVNKILDKFK